MNKKQGTFLSIIVLILLIIIAYVIVATNKSEKELTPREQAIEEEAARPEKTIQIKHQYKDGIHTFAGFVEAPSPCHEVTAMILPEEVPELQITVNDPASGVVCIQVISDKAYKVSFEGPEDLQFLATVNGEPVNLNQFEIPADQEIDAVDVFLKG